MLITPKAGATIPIVRGCGLKIIRYKRIDSTNTRARTLAEKGAADWTIVTAEVQTEGKGRLGRIWESPKGGLWFSLIIRPRLNLDRIRLLQFWAANALRRGIEEVYGIHSEVKWPNDIVIGLQKLAGILVETKTSGSELVYAVVGIGLNVNLDSEALPAGATSILIAGNKRFSPQKTLSSILSVMESQYGSLRDEETVVTDWWEHCAHRLKPVVIDADDGKFRGKSVGIDPDGSIIIQTGHGKVTIADGTLRVDA